MPCTRTTSIAPIAARTNPEHRELRGRWRPAKVIEKANAVALSRLVRIRG